MRSRLTQWIAVVSLTFVLGGHWAILQSVAWVTMAAGYAQCEPIKEALVKTFDGRHPCQICKFVAAGKKSQQRQEAPSPPVKLDLFLVHQSVALYPPSMPPADLRPADLPGRRALRPPTPPPRAA